MMELIYNIPADWEITKLKFFSKIFGRIGFRGYTVSDLVDEGEGAITLGPPNIVNQKLNLENKRYLSWEKYDESPEIKIYNGDLLLVKTASVGKVALVENLNEPTTINPQLVVFKDININSKFFYYAMVSDVIQFQLFKNINGGVISTLSQETIQNYVIPLPESSEQQNIVDYLDQHIDRVNNIISLNEQLIQLLEEKLTVLINHVITKGLNPNVPMKDSGIKWIDDIPSHWEVKRLKYNCFVNPSNKKSISNESLKINFLPMEKVSEDGQFDLESLAPYSSISKGYTYFENEDVLVSKITPCFENGKSALVKDLKYGFGFGSTEFHVIRFKEQILPEFVYYLIKSYAFRTIGQAFMHGTVGQKRVGTDFIEDYMMVTPPIEEQKEIIEYLDNETDKLTKAISKIQENIKLLEEYKTSLIHHVITGKIKVGNEV
ncbi:restriction endonuclease subunit S [Methanobrevibacter smithii]|uniref:restriction endonuclease subunit S n=1 Tax=Methanobrevibacter smithii TaxID=2173 RepID=UPI0003757492|nr:restriction endonuclease subunit S [Methanobrevibacter smithii]